MDSWLRPASALWRSRGSTTNLSLDNDNVDDLGIHHINQSTSRVNSLAGGAAMGADSPRRGTSFVGSVGLGLDSPRPRTGLFTGSFSSLNSPSLMDLPKQPSPELEAFPMYNPQDVDDVWVRPDLPKLVESLKTTMMLQDSMQPLPIVHNSTIMHVLESYAVADLKAKAKDKDISILKRRLMEDEAVFEGLAKEWKKKEQDYKAEIKRLELLLAERKGGVANVTLARGNSVVHGTRRHADVVESRMAEIRKRNRSLTREDDEEEFTDPIPLFSSQGNKVDPRFRRTQQRSSEKDRASSAILHQARDPQHGAAQIVRAFAQQSLKAEEESQTNKAASNYAPPRILNKSEVEARESGNYSSDSSNLPDVPSDDDSNSNDGSEGLMMGRGIALKIPTPIPEAEASTKSSLFAAEEDMEKGRGKQTTLDNYLSPSSRTHTQTPLASSIEVTPRRFSFQAGDDRDITQPRAIDETKKKLEVLFEKGGPSRPPLFAPLPQVKTTPTPPSMPNAKSRPSIGNTTLHTPAGLSREDSTNSIVTAIRDNSGRSTNNNSPAHGRERPKLRSSESGSGSSDARLAASRAVASAGKRSSLASQESPDESEARPGMGRMKKR